MVGMSLQRHKVSINFIGRMGMKRLIMLSALVFGVMVSHANAQLAINMPSAQQDQIETLSGQLSVLQSLNDRNSSELLVCQDNSRGQMAELLSSRKARASARKLAMSLKNSKLSKKKTKALVAKLIKALSA